MRKPWLAALSVLLAGPVALSACGSSSKSASTSPTSASSPGSAATTASGSEIRLGFICDCSGALASSFAGSKETIEAWADYVNAKGGLAGHPVKLYTMDDGDNSTTALTDVKELVQSDHIQAMVSETSAQDVVWASYIESQGIPVVGGDSVDSPFSSNPDFYPSGTTLLGVFYAQVAEAKRFGNNYAALYCVEDPACAAAVPIVKAAASALGMHVSYLSSFSSSAPNYTAICQAIKNSGADGYSIGGAAQTVITVTSDCSQQGVTAKISQPASTAGANLPGTPGAAGGVAELLDFPYFDDSVPATQAFHKALAQYYPTYASGQQENEAYIWAGGALMEAAVNAIPAGSAVTAASIKQGLYTLKDDTLGGVAPPLTFTPGQPASVNCYFAVNIGTSSYTEAQGLTPTCGSATAMAAIAQAAKSA